MNGKGLTMWFQVSCHKDREEATPFTVFGKLLKCKSSVRKQIFSVCELSQEIFLLFNFLLCSLTCEMYISLQWCFSAHRDKGKAFGGFFFFFWLYWVSISCMAISLFETSRGYSLLAGCMASSCGGFFCCVAPALGTRASVVSISVRLNICPSA